MRTLLRKFCRLHWLLVIILFALVTWGVWAIYNASSFREGLHLSGMWRTQLQWAVVGMIVFFIAAFIDYKWVRWGGWVMYVGGVIWLILPQLVHGRHGSSRPIDLWPLYLIPPSPVAMVSTVVGLAVVLGYLHHSARLLRHHALRLVTAIGIAVIPILIFLKQPDVGAALIIGLVLILMLLVASIPGRHLVLLLVAGICLVPLWYHFGLKPYQKKRVDVMVQMMTSPSMEVRGEAYMSDKVKVAVGSAGFAGKGPLSSKVDGRSVHRTFFTPTEAINDFIFAVIVEEFGLLGGLLQMALFLLLFLLCIHVAYTARDELGRMLVVGVVAVLFVCALRHMAMNICMFPTTGQSLPFTSCGGIYLLVCMFMMGLVQSVWIHRHDVAPVPPPLPSPEAAAENCAPSVTDAEGAARPPECQFTFG
ncbi:FtsW/RodA/SpoVE family cell cycle protein [Verrucomicrobium spinosum]|uniref:FtsW/RodA/SpoVE family cell cycle protein n=2 Tax=Verrucomicrobium spinosum TaxID=2736 RepID=UPI0001744E7F|nr:FtsW/RodA/SpoVE family cell cycle protein [Verrucomicrobium spinosum]